MTVSVVIADDHPIFRRGLRELIQETTRFCVVEEVSDGGAALAAIRKLRPAVAVLDIAMPGADGLAVLEELRGWADKPRVVLLTMYDDYVQEAMRLGAAGYILKENAEDALIDCLEAVIRGEQYVSEGVSFRNEENAIDGPLALLTRTERRILRLIAELKTSREIGELLSVSHRTVQNHRTNMCQKLRLQGDKALLRFALKQNEALRDG